MPAHRFQTVAEYLSAQPQPVCDIGHVVAGIVDEELPDAVASLWHGHPTWRIGKAPVAAVRAYTRHVTLALWRGATVEDPSGRLAGADGSAPATVKLRNLDDVDPELFASWLRQAAGVERARAART